MSKSNDIVMMSPAIPGYKIKKVLGVAMGARSLAPKTLVRAKTMKTRIQTEV